MASTSRHWGLGLVSSFLLACAVLPAPGALTDPARAAPVAAIQAQAPSLDEFKAVLSGYGQYIYSERYGEVWKPSVVPAGWHPYPACRWVYDRTYGWTYDDPSVWGKIVHHYGRWASDGSNGWVWVPGTQWSPAWVIWRSGGDWTGWAPTPPASDQQEISLANFNVDRQWTFIETVKLGNRCDDGPSAAPAGTFAGSTPVTRFKIVRGIAVFVLPPPTLIVDYDTGPVASWSSEFLGEWLLWLNTAASAASLSVGDSLAACAPPPPPAAPMATPIAVPAPAAPRMKSWSPPPPRSSRRREVRQTMIPDAPRSRRRVYDEPGPYYGDEPPIYIPPRRRRPPVWNEGPVVQRPPRYPRPGPVITPSNNPTKPNSGQRYRWRPRPTPDSAPSSGW
ncbi:DUF6600 domain-containing protein [Labrys sp. (in: a-proteobacteria)]|uniref:DUF6600 domain-containing protein n=1 Tax=Labrys sp. (in: a-proteobacteria) TaxID=1917972 RepID=UPI0039E55460